MKKAQNHIIQKKRNKNDVIEEIKAKIKIEEKNIVFLNYYKKGYIPAFGVNNLFRKIIELFKETKTYRNRKNDLISKAKNFKEKAQKQLNTKFILKGTIVGIIPFVDSFLRKGYIKDMKDNIFQTFEMKETENKKENSQILEQSSNLIGASLYGGGTFSILNRAVTITEQVVKTESSWWFWTKEITENVTKEAVSNVKLFGGIGALAGSAIIGLATGVFSMINEKKDLEKMIDELYNWYLNNSEKIGDSYEKAISYLDKMEKNYLKNGA